MRLFVAIDPPETAQDHLAAAIAELAVVRSGVRVTARALWHVTLAFLGDLPDDRLDGRTIAKIVVDPINANIIYVAVSNNGVNGQLGKVESPLRDGDTVMLVTPMEGG